MGEGLESSAWSGRDGVDALDLLFFLGVSMVVEMEVVMVVVAALGRMDTCDLLL